MNDLLNLAIKAHGGLERWRQLRSPASQGSLNVPFGGSRDGPTACCVLMRADTRQPALTITPFPSPGMRSGIFAPDRRVDLRRE